ncbi:MAG: twin-arginine translocase TatA/TatE family subunit [Deltaproteobacteria bacterium]|nr:twin-arginine translocase TatA/TatE family subunit [Deltaproteobacteria bacterium]
MFGLGSTELIVIGIIILLIFGLKRLPEIGKGLGGAVREFRKIKKDLREESKNPVQQEAAKGGKTESKQMEERITRDAIQKIPGADAIKETKDKLE